MKIFKRSKENMDNVKISSPWVSFWHKINAMFENDPDIKLKWDEEKREITFYVQGVDKSEALSKILPEEKTFGNVSVAIKVVPANKSWDTPNLFRKAFEGNPVYGDTTVVAPPGSNNPFCYVSFKHDVLQYWDDNLGDPHGNVYTLAQEVAKDIFDKDGVYFTTLPDYEW